MSITIFDPSVHYAAVQWAVSLPKTKVKSYNWNLIRSRGVWVWSFSDEQDALMFRLKFVK